MMESNRKDFKYKKEWREWKEQYSQTEPKTESEKEDHTDDWRDGMYFVASMILLMWSVAEGIPDDLYDFGAGEFIFFSLLAIGAGMILHIIGNSVRRRHESLIAKFIGLGFMLSAYGVLYLRFIYFT